MDKTQSCFVEDFVAYSSREKTAQLALGSVGFVIVGLWATGVFWDEPVITSRLIVLGPIIGFFAVCAVTLAGRAYNKREQLRIGATGIRSEPWSNQTIPWAEIKEVKTKEIHGQKMITLILRERDLFPARNFATGALARMGRVFMSGDINIALTGTDRRFEDAVFAIAQFMTVDASNRPSETGRQPC